MAIPALDSLIDEIQLEFNDSDGNLATDALVTGLINEAQRKIVDRFVAEGTEYFLRYNADTTSADTSDYALENDHIAMQKVEVSYDGTNFYTARKQRIQDDFPNRSYTTTEPKWYYIGSTSGARQIRIRPTPATGQVGTGYLRLYEYAYPAALSGTDTPPPPIYGAYYLLKWYALYRLESIRGKLNEATIYLRQYEDGMNDVINQLIVPDSSTPEMIATVDNDFDGWRSYS